MTGGLERREFGIINLGTDGEVVVDGEVHPLGHRDGLYAGRGSSLVFRGRGARFYVVSAPAHTAHPAVRIPFADTVPGRARQRGRGRSPRPAPLRVG